jgi:hypothetical protein
MNIRSISAVAAAAVTLVLSVPAQAQLDPRAPLGQLITAFQVCGPPQTYQMLSPQLFQLIYQQTGGTGCYQQIAAAGPIVNMQVIDQRQFPVGPVFAIRVTHQSGVQADWFMGINQFTQRIEYLNFQGVGASAPQPTVIQGPTQPQIDTTQLEPPPVDRPRPSPTPGPSNNPGCELYPVMCQ